MKNNDQSMIVRIRKNIFIKFHGFLLVTTKKINFYSFHTNTLHPSHFLFSGNGSIHPVFRSLRRFIPKAVGVIPEANSYSFVSTVLYQLFHFVTTYFTVPPVVYQCKLLTYVDRDRKSVV